ncbi:MAG TPA: cyclic nucleotide-binding domain-containing protein [Planctomycetota bacterium]|nr:cyclic nucleotide-binding domain-containing protein [Planctomycetota bacterium]
MPIYLAVHSGPATLANKKVMMPKAVSIIGSSPDADIPFVGLEGLAPMHCKIWLDGRSMKIEALYFNAVSVNGKKAISHQIELNSTFQLGDVLTLRFEHVPSSQLATNTVLPIAGDRRPPTVKALPEEIAAQKAARAFAEAPTVKSPAGPKPPAAPPKKEPPRAIAEVQLPYGEVVTLEELNQIAIFQGMPGTTMSKLPGSVVRRRFKAGETICREGEYGFTAFYILEGQCEVFIGSPVASVKSIKQEANRSGVFGLLREFKHRLLGRKAEAVINKFQRKFIPVDGPEDLPLDNPIGVLKTGDLFGEMSCTSLYPRSATVRATTDCEMLEMLGNVLIALKDNPAYKVRYDREYRNRALSQHLRGVGILAGLDDEFIDQLKERVELVSYKKGQVIVKEGDPADAFFLIRFGNVKVSKQYPGGEIVLNYLGRSEFFGEIGLIRGGMRTATCTALDHVECVRIKKPDFDFMLSWYDDIRENLEKAAAEREKAASIRSQNVANVQLDDFLNQGLMQAQSLLLLDLKKCTRCDECVRACADSHDGITRLVREGLHFDSYLVATSCRSCQDPVCMPGCPVGSIHRQESMEILIEDWCIGCGLCARNCPYGNITMHAFAGDPAEHPSGAKPNAVAEMAEIVKKAAPKEKKKAVTCDLCHELNEPSCVYACPHDAAYRVDARKFFSSGGDVASSKV